VIGSRFYLGGGNCLFGSGNVHCSVMAKAGRPTQDPKGERITVRVAPRDLKVLKALAAKGGVPLAEAARRVLRGALGIPALPSKVKRNKPGRKS
jgi:hypothetical protein